MVAQSHPFLTAKLLDFNSRVKICFFEVSENHKGVMAEEYFCFDSKAFECCTGNICWQVLTATLRPEFIIYPRRKTQATTSLYILRRCRLQAVKNATKPFKMLLTARKTLEKRSFQRARHIEGGGVAALALLRVEIAGDMLLKINCTRSISPSIAFSASIRMRWTICSGKHTNAHAAAKIG